MGMSVGNSSGEDGEGYKPLAEINVTPFVDVMLVLLIIFMVAAPLMVQGVPLELPKTSATKLGTIKKPKVVTLAPDGKLYILDVEVTAHKLVSLLMALKSQEVDVVVYVRAVR
jgi:biopolymer transport protein TolR